MTDKFSLAATGETLSTRRSSCYHDERFLSMLKILREADVAFTNLETQIHTFKGYPMPNETMGTNTHQQADPFVAEELKWIGFNLLARANNHAMDYGHEMLQEQTEILDQLGLVHAGAGMNLAEATMPAYLDTAKGRAALVSLCMEPFPAHCPAGEQRRDLRGRPGMNPIRNDDLYVLDPSSFANLGQICQKLGLERSVRDREIVFLQNRFQLSDEPAKISTLRKADVDRNVRAVKDAKRAADYVFVSLHHHTNHGGPALRVQEASRILIDAGADAIIGHGPHVIQGIEIYNGKPIFYSLGNFFYQTDTMKKLPAELYERVGLGNENTPQDFLDVREQLRTGKIKRDGYDAVRSGEWYMRWFETILTVCNFEGDRISEIRLYPVTTYHESRAQRGRPILADEQSGKRIIDYTAKCSSKWGTDIGFSDGIGYVNLTK